MNAGVPGMELETTDTLGIVPPGMKLTIAAFFEGM